MATAAPRSFRRAAKKQADRPVVTFTLDWVDDEDEEKVYRSDTFSAKMPTDERLFLVAAMVGDEDNEMAAAAGVMELFRDILSPREYRILKDRLADPEDSVDMEVLQDVLEWLMEKWSDFPTQPSRDSSTSPTSSGTKSTGRVRGQGSIRSNSPSTAS